MVVPAWIDVAIGEEAAIYAYGVLAAKLGSTQRQQALRDLDAHRRARDLVRSRLASVGSNPTAPSSFEIPVPVTDTDSARLLAAGVELRLIDQYLAVVATAPSEERRPAAEAAQAAAVRAQKWGWQPTAFPGAQQPEPAANLDAGVERDPGRSQESADAPGGGRAPEESISHHDGAAVQ